MKRTAVTGHRPKKLNWGYDYNEPHWIKLKEIFKNKLIQLGTKDAYTGMALGVDTVFALAVIELKKAGYDIKLHAAIPCSTHCKQWPQTSQKLYYHILTHADEIIGMSEESPTRYEELALYVYKHEYILLKKNAIANVDFTVTPLNNSMIYTQTYKPYLMQKRNEYMVDNTESIIAIWDGMPGGTENCIKYARQMNKNIIQIKPKDIA